MFLEPVWSSGSQRDWVFKLLDVLAKGSHRGFLATFASLKCTIYGQCLSSPVSDEVVVVAFSSLARISGEGSSIHFPPVF